MKQEWSSEPVSGTRDASASLDRHVDEACDRFEAACMAGKLPRIEDYLKACDDLERAAFLRELIPIDLAYRRGRGEKPDSRSYLTRFPGHESLILKAFGETIVLTPPAAQGENLRASPRSTLEARATRTRLRLSDFNGPHAGR